MMEEDDIEPKCNALYSNWNDQAFLLMVALGFEVESKFVIQSWRWSNKIK